MEGGADSGDDEGGGGEEGGGDGRGGEEEVAKGVRTGVEGTEEVVMVVEAMAAEETVVKATREEGWEERVHRGWR